MEEDSYKLLEWGLEEESCLQIKSLSLGAVVQFREKEFLVLGQKEITRFESTIVKESYPYALTSLVPIPQYDILIGVTAVSPEFIILLMSDLRKNIMTGVKVNDQSVFNIIFSSKSNTIITSGENLISWSLSFTPAESSVVFTYPKVEISMKKIILSHTHSSIMNAPMFDFSREELYINDNKGSIQSYNLNGTSNGTAIRYGICSQTACGFYENTQHFMTTNSSQGAILWPKRIGGINKRFYVGTSASLAIQFIDDEYVAILDAKYMITIVDTKTSNFFNCYQSTIPVHRMFYFPNPYPRIVLCAGRSVILLKVNLPWRFWNSTLGRPISITRSNKKNEAARITVVLENSHVRLISPKTSCILTAATLTSLSTPLSCYYDRGHDDQTQRDQLLIPLQDCSMQIFSTGQDPCEMIGTIDFKITSICQCKFRNELSFCFGTNFGQLLFYSYSTMKPLGRIVCNYKYPIIGIFYDKESECLILSFDKRVGLVSLTQEKEIGDYLNTKISRLSLFFDRIAIYATDHGLITSIYVLNQRLQFHETNSMRLHDDSITGFSLGSTFFVSSSLDKTVKVWSKDFNVICKLIFPLQILQCCVMNGKRDILAATLNEIMLIKGTDVFGQNVDLEDEVYDNYDRKTDFLDNSVLLFKEEEEKEESVFAGRKKKSDSKKSRFNARRKRIIEALKKQLSMQQSQIPDFDDIKENDQKYIDNNMIKLPNGITPKPPQKEEKPPSTKEKVIEDNSYEYLLEEEEEDRKSRSSQPLDSISSQKIENSEDENDRSAFDEEKEKEELEKKRKLLEKQMADKEREEKEKEILKAYNDAQRAKTIQEPKSQSRTRPGRPRAPQSKTNEDDDEDDDDCKSETFSEINEKRENSGNDQNHLKKSNLDDKTKANDSSKKKAKKDESDSNEDGNSTKKDRSKNKSKNVLKDTTDKSSESEDKEGSNKSSNLNKDKSKSSSPNKDKENKSKSSSPNKDKDKENKSKSSSPNKDKENKSKNKSKSSSPNKDKENKSKDGSPNKDKESNRSSILKNDKESSTKNENENQKKSKSKSLKKQIQNQLYRKGCKNASTQTVDPSLLRKIGSIPKSVPSNIAIVPQMAKVRRIRRSPTPPTYRPQRARRPLFEGSAMHKRSRTPEPLRFIVDGSAPPVHLFFDLNMVKKMAESGDQRYVSLLHILERQGLKNSKFPSFSPQPPNNSPSKGRRGMPNSTPSWGFMMILPPTNISQIQMPRQLDHITSQSHQVKSSIEKVEEEMNQDLNRNSEDGEVKKFTNHQASPTRFSSNYSNDDDVFANPSFLLDNPALPAVKKIHKSSNRARGASVPNMNRTIAEMNFCREQLMLKIKEKREKEAIINYEDDQIGLQLDSYKDRPDNNSIEEEEENEGLNEIDDVYLNENVRNVNEKYRISNVARYPPLNINPRFSNPVIPSRDTARAPTFVEPIMPIYLRSSKDVRYIRQEGISPFACKRYRMVVDSNGPRDLKSLQAYHSPNKCIINNNRKALIDQYVRSPRQLLKPLQMVKERSKH